MISFFHSSSCYEKLRNYFSNDLTFDRHKTFLFLYNFTTYEYRPREFSNPLKLLVFKIAVKKSRVSNLSIKKL